jgi:hypothetical protein
VRPVGTQSLPAKDIDTVDMMDQVDTMAESKGPTVFIVRIYSRLAAAERRVIAPPSRSCLLPPKLLRIPSP